MDELELMRVDSHAILAGYTRCFPQTIMCFIEGKTKPRRSSILREVLAPHFEISSRKYFFIFSAGILLYLHGKIPKFNPDFLNYEST